MQKPYRFLMERVSTYAEEGSAYLRRRRIRSQPFVRVWRRGGTVEAVPADGDVGRRLNEAAERLLSGPGG